MKPEENKRMLALSCIVADLKAENVELEHRVHQLVDEYNEVVRQLNGNEKRNVKDSSKPANDEMQQTLAELEQMREHCDKLEKDNEQLKRQCVQLQTERNEAKTHADECELQKEGLFKHIARFDNSEFLKIGDYCTHRVLLPDGTPVKVGYVKCNCCRHCIKVDESGRKCVLCACRCDNTKAK